MLIISADTAELKREKSEMKGAEAEPRRPCPSARSPQMNAVLLIAVGACCIRVACVPNYGGFSSAAADISTQRGTEKARI